MKRSTIVLVVMGAAIVAIAAHALYNLFTS